MLGLVLGIPPLTWQFGLPDEAILRGIGLALIAGAGIAALGLQRTRRPA